MIYELIRANRSYRRFDQSVPVELAALRELIALGRFSPSAANLQPLKYMLSCDPAKNALIFEDLAWAGYLTDWPGPAENERPTAYIIVLGDTQISETIDCDHGIAAQSILLGAAEKGLGGCMIGSVKRQSLREKLAVPDHLKILLVIAIGKPCETVVLEDVGPNKSVKYYRDKQGVHHVPKRTLDEIIVV